MPVFPSLIFEEAQVIVVGNELVGGPTLKSLHLERWYYLESKPSVLFDRSLALAVLTPEVDGKSHTLKFWIHAYEAVYPILLSTKVLLIFLRYLGVDLKERFSQRHAYQFTHRPWYAKSQ